MPEKTRISRQRLRSTYDNLSMDEMATQYNFHRNNSHCSIQALTHTASLDNPAADPSNPPPLPLKKKHSKLFFLCDILKNFIIFVFFC